MTLLLQGSVSPLKSHSASSLPSGAQDSKVRPEWDTAHGSQLIAQWRKPGREIIGLELVPCGSHMKFTFPVFLILSFPPSAVFKNAIQRIVY